MRATAKLSHWNTVEIFDYGRTDDGTFYYVMEYLPGLSLAELVEQHGPLPPRRGSFICSRSRATRWARPTPPDLIHRDIKPGNIFAAIRGGYSRRRQAARFRPGQADCRPSTTVQLTQEGSITGSPLLHVARASDRATANPTPAATSIRWGPWPISC